MSATFREAAPDRFHTEGELSFATVTSLWRQSRRLLDKAAGRVFIDLSGVTRADSAALALMVEWLRLADRHGFELHLTHLPPRLATMARAYELEPILPLSGKDCPSENG